MVGEDPVGCSTGEGCSGSGRRRDKSTGKLESGVANFVLVHGAWHGGWCWRFVRPLLKGHQVFAPSLTGLGERTHLARPDIDLDTHIADVVSLLEMEDLRDVILVGHSYGGMVVTGAADRALNASNASSTWTRSFPRTANACWITWCPSAPRACARRARKPAA